MDRNQIEQTVLAVLSAVLKHPFPAGTDVRRGDCPAWDSLRHIEIMFTLEDELGMEFSETELAALDSVTKIVEAALAKYEA
jgi:acyl carrier protein